MATLRDILGAIYRKDRQVLSGLDAQALDAADADGRTPLMHAVLEGDPQIVRLLLERGADPNAADHGRKWTALHFAADNENEANVRQLLEAGAAVDPVDSFGNTPLWRAVMSSSSDFAAIRELLKHGADPGRKNYNGKAPLDVASDAGLHELSRILTGERR
jgi:ankyrin repeat protein